MLLPFRVNLLGPVEARSGDDVAQLGRRERAVVALLALHAGSVVPAVRIIDELWPDGPPDTAVNVVQGIVSRLRRSLGPDAVTTAGAGYALNRSRVDTDLDEFERLAAAGRGALADQPADVAQQLRQALALWYGEPLSDLQDLRFAQMEAVRLHERRMLVLEDRIAADLACGTGPMILDELADLERRHPFREGLVATRMRALAQAGRRVEALDAYAAFRRRLVDEIGLEPTAPLRDLHQALLDDDGAPQPPMAPTLARAPLAGSAGPATGERVGDTDLPAGTVTFLLSDIDGSTARLSRLSPACTDELLEQRRVLRQAWGEHGGIEFGAEGDSCSVVFTTAPAAVAAATQAQRDLAELGWPSDEPVRVRIGIHTGNPAMHDGTYVGTDVHRAARIAAAAHGGQVVLSSAAAELVAGSLPNGVRLRDLGSHQLKDIPRPEHLLQLAIEGLPSDFGPLRTLGTASSLPQPPTPLVGRDGELAELTALLGSPQVRLVTLTGPGGSGKTRLAITVAQLLVERFPDGVYFVPLAAVTTADVMWTTIAEALDVPPEGRIPPGLFDHVAHRSALFVLDNLEQIDEADMVVAELLDHAAQTVVVATSRRPLAVAAQHVRPVPPLQLPYDYTFEQAQASEAVQLFVQHARKVNPAFALTAGNAGHVSAVCRQLDGLPLAIELAAARTRLLAPKALLARLDTSLDIKASAVDRPSRQHTLRDTIAWSYDLLNQRQQAFFRRLGVFAGGADLDAIEVVCGDLLDGKDALDVAAELVDASLATIGEGADGEPRVGMLVTIRAFAMDRLHASGETVTACAAHAAHFAAVADKIRADTRGPRQLAAQQRFDIELDNFREALGYLFESDDPTTAAQRVALGRRLCKSLGWFWTSRGYLGEGRRWLERSVTCAVDGGTLDMADNLARLAELVSSHGEYRRSKELAEASLAIARQHDGSPELPVALSMLGWALLDLGETDAARQAFEEAVEKARLNGDPSLLGSVFSDLAGIEFECGNHPRSHELLKEALALAKEQGDPLLIFQLESNVLTSALGSGDLEHAHRLVSGVVTQALTSGYPSSTLQAAESYAELLIKSERAAAGAGLLGACAAMRERVALHRFPADEAHEQQLVETGTAAMPAGEFQRLYEAGRMRTVEEVLAELEDR